MGFHDCILPWGSCSRWSLWYLGSVKSKVSKPPRPPVIPEKNISYNISSSPQLNKLFMTYPLLFPVCSISFFLEFRGKFPFEIGAKILKSTVTLCIYGISKKLSRRLINFLIFSAQYLIQTDKNTCSFQHYHHLHQYGIESGVLQVNINISHKNLTSICG